MSNPLWPDPASLPFKLFGAGETPPSLPPFAQGMAGGMDLVKKFWGNLPGGTALPGFLVPTVDVAELDKRLSDLRAAESWVEVNLNMLRATIQGLEVQRNTIATIQSLSAMAEGVLAGKAPAPVDAPPAVPAGWPMMPVREAPAPEPLQATAAAPAAPAVEAADPPNAEPSTGKDPLVDLAANNWLGFMQQQFMKVAQAAIAPAEAGGATKPANGPARKPGIGSKPVTAKKTARRRGPVAR